MLLYYLYDSNDSNRRASSNYRNSIPIFCITEISKAEEMNVHLTDA